MTDKQYDKFMKDLEKEMENFKKRNLQMTKEQIYNNFYEISAYNEFFIFLNANALSFDRKGFANKNILQDIYYEFMGTSYELDHESLDYFFADYVKDNIKHKRFTNQGEM